MSGISLPADATKVNMDASSDDPKLARVELADLVDKFNSQKDEIGSDRLQWNSALAGVTYASATSFTTTDASNCHVGRMVQITGSATGTVHGPITGISGTTISVAWAALTNEALSAWLAINSVVDSSIPWPAVDARAFGALPDNFVTSRNTEILAALLFAGAANLDLYIPRGVLWGYDEIPSGEASTIQAQHPDEVTIYDDSGWDWVNDDQTGQRKIIQKTVSPGTKNAHEWQLLAAWNPGVIIDVVSGASDPEIAADPSKARCSIVWRRDGASKWQAKLDPGTDGSQKDNFSLSRYPAGGGESFLVASLDDGRVSWNGGSLIPSGVTWVYKAEIAATAIFRWTAAAANGISWQYLNETNGQLYREDIAADGTRTLYNTSDLIAATITENYQIAGLKANVAAKTNTYAIDDGPAKNESGTWFTNEGAAGGFVFTLPTATAGQSYKFFVAAAENLEVNTNGTDVFRGLATSVEKRSSTIGSWLEVYCAVAGIWEFREVGTWADV